MSHPSPDRLDLPRTLRDLYPRSRSRASVHVVAPPHATGLSPRTLALLLAAAVVVVALGVGALAGTAGTVALVGLELAGIAGMVAQVVASIVGLVLAVIGLFALRGRGARHGTWARVRRLVPVGVGDVRLPEFLEWSLDRPSCDVHAWRAVVGDRRLAIHVAMVAWKDEDDDDVVAYVASVRLPPGTADRLPASTLDRRSRRTLVDQAPRRGRVLELESERLRRAMRLRVDGGDDLDWRRLFDPALVDLLDDGIDVEWHQDGDTLLLLVPGDGLDVDPRRIDTLAIAAVAIERRVARIVGHGREVGPAGVPVPAGHDAASTARRHLRRERARDLAMTPDQLFAELARYATEDEVRAVRAKVDAGTFPLHMLDDLVHHRRSTYWDTGSDAA